MLADKYVGAEVAALEGPDGDDRAGTRQIAFTIAVIALGAKMAKVDGQVDRSEIAAFKEVLPGAAERDRQCRACLRPGQADARGFEPYAQQIAKMFRRGHPVLEELLDGLFHIGAGGREGPRFGDRLPRRGWRGCSASPRRTSRGSARRMSAPDTADPYTILGVTRAMSNDEIRAAWRKLARDNHPDRLIAQGLPEEFVTLANQKLATINAAYDKVSKERGIN